MTAPASRPAPGGSPPRQPQQAQPPLQAQLQPQPQPQPQQQQQQQQQQSRPQQPSSQQPSPQRRPRVGVDFHTFDGVFQGSRSHLLGLYGAAVRQAPEIDFVLLSGRPQALADALPAFRAPNVRCEALPPGGGLARLGWQLGLARRRLGIDLLHLQYRLPLWPFGPCAVTVHDVLFETHPQFFAPGFVRMARWTGRRSVRRAALLLTVSDFSRGEMARLYGLAPQRIVVTPNAVDPARFHPPAASGSAAAAQETAVLAAHGLSAGGYACTVGRIEPRKNHAGLLAAWARLPRPRLPLLVIGQRDGGGDGLEALLDQDGLRADVRFLDRVDDAALPVLLRHARLFAYPSFAEGFGMPVLEAMASGVPVLTSAGTALSEVAGEAAVAVDPQDPVAIAAGLRALLDDAAARERAAAAGLARAAGFRWEAAAAVFVAALRGYFAGAGSGGAARP